MDEKPNKYEHQPIPTYEEAISSLTRPSSSRSYLGGPAEVSDDAERQGLLGGGGGGRNPTNRRTNYEPPTVESERNSLDSLDGLEDDDRSDGGGETAEVRREMQEMDFEDPNSPNNASNRSLLAGRFKRFTNFTSSFSSLSLSRLPSLPNLGLSGCLSSIRWPWWFFPQIDWAAMDANRVVIIGRLFGVFMIMGILYVFIASDLLSFGRGGMRMGERYDPESVRGFIQAKSGDPMHIERYLRHITQFPHTAGTEGNYVLGEWVAEIFKEHDFESVSMERFDVYLNYPRKDGRRVAIVEPQELQWEAQLEEDGADTLVFHGHSKSGDVTGPLIYANYGAREDFQKLKDMDISVEGAIVLVRYYGTEGDRALKVKAAEEAGAVGCIIYSDPAEDGYLRGPVFPDGRFMPEDGVQRGAVSLMSWIVGDVLSPGWASTPANRDRLKPEDSAGLVQIPSIPIAWRDARHLLDALRNHGRKMDGSWQGDPNVEYWSGDQDSPKVNLKNLQDEEVYQPIYNVLGRITGEEQPNKKIIVGNHRDAWCLGAADPGSGTAIMLAVVHAFGELKRQGWRPLRTIEFASWDGEEYNLIGSTEHVENREEELRRTGIAYINIDVGAFGPDFRAEGSPFFDHSLRRVLNRVADPALNKTIREVWEQQGIELGGLGAGSDFVAFQDIVGTSSIDMSFQGPDKFPYHSCYDNYEWMEKFGDPSHFQYSATMAQILSLLILDLADAPLLPFDMKNYAHSLHKYVDSLDKDINSSPSIPNEHLDLTPIRNAVSLVDRQAQHLRRWDDQWSTSIYSTGGFESNAWTINRIDRNNKLANFETNLLDLSEGGGVPNRTQFKHVVFAPQKWSGYDAAFFPVIRDWVEVGNFDQARKAVQMVADVIETAAMKVSL